MLHSGCSSAGGTVHCPCPGTARVLLPGELMLEEFPPKQGLAVNRALLPSDLWCMEQVWSRAVCSPRGCPLVRGAEPGRMCSSLLDGAVVKGLNNSLHLSGATSLPAGSRSPFSSPSSALKDNRPQKWGCFALRSPCSLKCLGTDTINV